MIQYIVVGSGVAGVTAAQLIARADPGASVHLLGGEPYPYYQRPRLWAYIAGEIERQELFFRPAEWYAERGIQLHLGALVTGLDTTAHRLTLQNGEQMSYDRLLLATGGRSFVPPIEGANREGVFTLRTLDDADAIKAYAEQVEHVLVIGGGLLGLETAHALQGPDRRVTVLEVVPHLLPRQLDPLGADVLTRLMERLGLHVQVGVQSNAILGNERATGVRLADGREMEGGLVLLSTGMTPRIELARRAGLETNRGILVDKQLRTSAPDVYAAGDAAEFGGRVYGIIPAATEQARAAAANMVHAGSMDYDGTLPSTTLKLLDVNLTAFGEATVSGSEYTVLRYSAPDAGIYKRLTLREGRIVGAILLGDVQDARPLQQLIATRQDVSGYGSQLLDDSLDLNALAQGQAQA